MADTETTQEAEQDVEQEQVDEVQVESNDWIPRNRFNEVNNQMKELKKQLATIQEERESEVKKVANQRKKELEKQNEFETLYNESQQMIEGLNGYKSKYETLVEMIQTQNEAAIAKIPKNMQGLVPQFDDPIKLSEWLSSASSLLNKSAAPNLDGGSGGGSRSSKPAPDTPSQEWLIEQAQRLNLNPVIFAKQYGVDLQG